MVAPNPVYRIAVGRNDPSQQSDDLPDDVQRDQPRSFTLNALSGASSKLAEQFAGPEVVLASALLVVGAPVGFVGVLEPFRRGFATLPQLLLAPQIRRRPRRASVWAAASALQAGLLAMIAVAVAALAGTAAGVVVVVGLAVFSVFSGIASAAFSDTTGKTVSKEVRGRLMGLRSGLGGLATLLLAVFLIVGVGNHAGRGLYVGLIAAAAVLWAVAAGMFRAIPERPDTTTPEERPLATIRRGLAALRTVEWFRRFSIARVLLIPVEIVLPYFTLLVGTQTQGINIGFLLLTLGVAQVVGGPLWGRYLDRAGAPAGLALGGVLGGASMAVGVAAATLDWTGLWGFLAAVFLAGLGREGVRTARKAYVISAAPKSDRSLYTAASNSITGVVLLLSALLGVVAQTAGIAWLMGALAVVTALGAVVAVRLPAHPA